MAFLRVDRKTSGNYLSIAETYRTKEGKVRSRILYNIGKKEDYSPAQLRNIGTKLYQLGGGDLKQLLDIKTEEKARVNYGYYQVLSKAMKHYGLESLLAKIGKNSKLQFSLSNAVMLMLMERLHSPCSKHSSFHNQEDYLGIQPLGLQHLYRALDKLADNEQLIQKQIYQTGRDLFNSALDVVFYDVTTLYFESDVEKEGSLRQKGFSKDGKVGTTQVLFCMLIDRHKQPIGYRVFKGDTFEGHTFTKAVDDLKQQYQIDKVIIVADRGMLSSQNIQATTAAGYEFIVGERLRKLPAAIQSHFLDINNYTSSWKYTGHEGTVESIQYCTKEYQGRTIIGTYSAKRAKKDKHEREEKLQKAQSLLSRPNLITSKAGRYFLKKEGKESYVLDQEKITRDATFDGFLAIATNNNTLAVSEILDQYKQLYRIEHSFRTFKSHLEVRPMYHWTEKRIEGHICLCYIAYTLLNYLLIKLEGQDLKLTEEALRRQLDAMQLSLVENEGKQIYLRSAQKPGESLMQQKLGLKTLPNIIPIDLIGQYI
jgi:transposase